MAKHKIKLCECGCGVKTNLHHGESRKFLRGHNIKGTGVQGTGMLGKKLTEEHKRKISLTSKGNTHALGYKHTEEAKKKMSIKSKGRGVSKETREKLSKANKGQKFSKETREKLSIARKKRVTSEETKAKMSKVMKGNSYLKGHEHSEETKKKMSIAKIGSNHHNWQGGITNEEYGSGWTKQLKESIRKRDGCTCQLCDKTQKQEKKKLAVHHIDYNKKNNNEDNLISLCGSCHTGTNFNREEWQEYFILNITNGILGSTQSIQEAM